MKPEIRIESDLNFYNIRMKLEIHELEKLNPKIRINPNQISIGTRWPSPTNY